MVETFPDTSAHEPVPDPSRRLYLSTAATDVERELIRGWIGDQPGSGGPAGTVEIDTVEIGTGTSLAERLAGVGDDPLLVPLRVLWLPAERGGERATGWPDLLTLRDPRRPRSRSQARIARRHADRFQIVAAEPARLHELRARFEERGSTGSLAGFVVRQALLALERAERAVIGDRYKVPRLVVEEITSSRRFARDSAALAERLGRPTAEVEQQVRAALDELVAVQSRLAVDVFAATMRPFHARTWNVVADSHDLDALRELNRRHALVFLPSHRSYADPFVLAEALRSYDFPRNHVMGGANLAFWPLGPLAKRAGIVFIRRSFREDEAYKLAIREYFGYLVAKRFNLEWYFEGGRSRTGKLRPPRYGLLRYLAEAVLVDPVADVHLVPVSITYEHLPEVTAMAAEQVGVPKEREGLGWLARYARSQRAPAGDAVVRFGTPIGVRARLPGQAPVPDDALQDALHKLAFEVAVGINDATPVLPQSAVMLTMLGVGGRALTLVELQGLLDPVLRYVEARTIPQNGLPMLRRPAELRRVVEELVRVTVVTAYAGGAEPVYRVDPGKFLVAAFFRNNAIHWFVNRAIVELVMLAVGRAHGVIAASTTPIEEAFEQALRLRDLLKHEFFFDDKEAFRRQLAAEMDLLDPRWRERPASPAQARKLLASSGFVMAHRVLRSFLEAQFVVADRLAGTPPEVPIEAKAFLEQCEGMGRQMLMQGRLHSAEALSRELFAGAVRLAEGRGLVTAAGPDRADRRDLTQRREAFRAEIVDLVRRIELAAEIDARIAAGERFR